MGECIFCEIATHEKEADILYEDERLLVFRDINPKAPIHVLVVPKKHIASVNELEEGDRELVGDIVIVGKEMAKRLGTGDGYKLVFNVGRKGGQIIDHLHLHLLGGW